MIKTAYKDLLDQLKTINGIKFIDIDRGQYDEPGNNYIPVFPAALINFGEIPWGDVGDYVLSGSARITIKVAFTIYDDINNLTPDDIVERGLNDLEILNSINLALHGFTGNVLSKLQHVGTFQENNGQAVIFNETFSCEITDRSARDKHYTEDTITLNVQATKQ